MFPLFRATDIFQYGRYSTGRESAKFQAQRKGRLHAGFDFDSTLDTPIHAPIDLEIIRKPYLYYRETYAIDLKSQDHVFRFCEIKDPTTKQEGEILKKGEFIGKIGDLKLTNIPNMLHLEVYSLQNLYEAHWRETQSLTLPSKLPYKRVVTPLNPENLIEI